MDLATSRRTATDEIFVDAAVIGGGLAGLAISIHLAKSGFRVICFEPKFDFDRIIGESLDWSAPELLEQLELPMEQLIQSDICTYKRHLILRLRDESEMEYVPSPWLGRPPLNIELRTMHVDRVRLHRELLRIAELRGVVIRHDRINAVQRSGSRVAAIHTDAGQRVTATWFIDASGSSSSFFGREFRLPQVEYGPRKVAMWTYFPTPLEQEGTTLYADAPPRQYMEWVWEIPINQETISVGYVTTGAAVKRKREQSLSISQIFRQQLMKFDRFRKLLWERDAQTPNVTSFTCRAFNRVCGPNWFIIGEAASLPDPITGNGVTAALRHAAEAARLICRFRRKQQISRWSRAAYNLRVLYMSKFFNSLIEKLAYDWPVRDRIGLIAAGDVYTIPAWSINHLYSRFRPDGMLSTVCFGLFLASLRSVGWLVYRLCKLFPTDRPRCIDSVA